MAEAMMGLEGQISVWRFTISERSVHTLHHKSYSKHSVGETLTFLVN